MEGNNSLVRWLALALPGNPSDLAWQWVVREADAQLKYAFEE
jgi:hypothetical protein